MKERIPIQDESRTWDMLKPVENVTCTPLGFFVLLFCYERKDSNSGWVKNLGCAEFNHLQTIICSGSFPRELKTREYSSPRMAGSKPIRKQTHDDHHSVHLDSGVDVVMHQEEMECPCDHGMQHWSFISWAPGVELSKRTEDKGKKLQCKNGRKQTHQEADP